MAYTVLGDAVNLGSRQEGLTKQYGTHIIVSESTKTATPEFAYLELDRVRIKGKREPVAITSRYGKGGKQALICTGAFKESTRCPRPRIPPPSER